jgi:hypothetical protein
VVTSYHNLYDDFGSTNESDFIIYGDAIICQKVTKDNENQPLYHNPILVKLCDRSYKNDWAVLEVVKGNTKFYNIFVQENPVDLDFLKICPNDVKHLPQEGLDELKVHYYDISLFNSSKIEGEKLICQRYDYRRVCSFNEKNHVCRVQDGLSRGSSGCPYINKLNMVVAIHIASLDSSLQRDLWKIEELVEQNISIGRKRAAPSVLNDSQQQELTNSQQQELTNSQQQECTNSENISILSEEISSIVGSFTNYKEGFVLSTDEQFNSHLIKE